MNLNRLIILGLLFTVTLSCTNDSESDLIGSTPENITYSETIEPIIRQNCITCHSQPPLTGVPMPLVTYDNLKDAVETRGLINRITSTDPNFLMPYGGPRLPQSEINKIIAWRDANFPE